MSRRTDAGGASASRPIVVVAGRPNVGKSSLVNRIVGRRAAVVQEEPGVTRDRKALDAEWTGVPFTIVDTGGWLASGTALDDKVSAQAEKAVAQADLVLLVVDVTVGVTEDDLAAARVVRRTKAPVRLVVNKVDDVGREGQAWEFVSLGVGDPWPVSAIHGRGTGDLLDEVVGVIGAGARAEATDGKGGDRTGAAGAAGADVPGLVADHAPELGELVSEDGRPPRVALVGRPNVGKSTLFNRLIGEERAVVHDMPGTTRDTIDTVVVTPEGPLCFVDTAGMRRRSRTEWGPESYSVLRALDALEEADIALLVIDATVGATHQDQRLAERIGVSGCAAVVVLNKWDLVATGDREDVMAGVGERLAFLGIAPVLRVSATSGRGAHKILPALIAAVDAYHQRVSTGALNRALREIQASHAAPGARIRYGVQGAIDPPTFTLFATGRLPQTYLRYVERGLREHFDLGPTPIKLRVRAGGGR
ncbi:MAG TPA: ribosome biogenesis GTPase Der [Acidimicrobiales bacterium]|nr:ribosome biogenesis GTPase Der [Acidimicrobiales bacterium]